MSRGFDEPFRSSIFNQVGAAAGRQGTIEDNIRRMMEERKKNFRPRTLPVQGGGVLRQVAPAPGDFPPINDHPRSVLIRD